MVETQRPERRLWWVSPEKPAKAWRSPLRGAMAIFGQQLPGQAAGRADYAATRREAWQQIGKIPDEILEMGAAEDQC